MAHKVKGFKQVSDNEKPAVGTNPQLNMMRCPRKGCSGIARVDPNAKGKVFLCDVCHRSFTHEFF